MKTSAFGCFVAVPVAVLSACALPSSDGRNDSEQDVSRTSSPYSVSQVSSWLPARGGSGGSGPDWLGCWPGDVVVGFYGRAGNYIDQLGLLCATLHRDGTLGPQYTTNAWGGSGGSPFSTSCPWGEAAMALAASTGQVVNYMQMGCAAPPFTSYAAATSVEGSPGGTWAKDLCPRGYVLTGMNVRHGAYIDQLQGFCEWIAP